MNDRAKARHNVFRGPGPLHRCKRFLSLLRRRPCNRVNQFVEFVLNRLHLRLRRRI